MASVAERLMEHTRVSRPKLYEAILNRIRPHGLDSVLRLIERHLHKIDLRVLNENAEAVPEFMWALIKHMKFPTPGDAIGIIKACRATKSDTQSTLDSKHLSSLAGFMKPFNVESNILHDLAQFSTQKQVFEFSNRRKYSTVYTSLSIEDLMKILPESCHLVRGAERNKGIDSDGQFRYLSGFKYILVDDRGSIKILYQTLKDLYNLLRRIPPGEILAFSDVRTLFQKCGIVSHFFNMVNVVEKQLFVNDDSAYETDVLFLIKYQCRSGKPLPYTREGLAKNADKTPLEIASFEAIKTNLARASISGKWYDVDTSSDAIFFGQQFKEGTGYNFALLPKD